MALSLIRYTGDAKVSSGVFFLFFFIKLLGSSDFFHFPKFQGGPTYILHGGGGGVRQTFFEGGGVQLLSNRTCDLYLTPVPSRSAQLSRILIDYSDSLFGCLFSSFIMYPPRCMFYSNLKV